MNAPTPVRRLLELTRDPGRVLRALARRAPRFLGHENYVPFVVLSRSRTGSNLLVSFLNSHPHAYAEAEILGRLGSRDPHRVLHEAYGRQARYIRAKGFKLFYYHPVDRDGKELWDELAAMDHLHVLHLRRRNILRTLTSRRIAELRDHWTSAESTVSSAPAPISVAFSKDELAREFERTCRWELDGQRLFADHAVHDVLYEELVGDPVGQFRRITEFLGLDSCVPKTRFRRQNPQRLSELISNYRELKEAFRGSPWQDFFED